MSAAAQPELHTPTGPVRGRTNGILNTARRHASVIGLTLWATAAAALAVHSMGAALPDPTRFAMLESWVVGIACLGCPVLALRSLGRQMKPEVCIGIAIFCFTLAGLLTVLTLGGAIHPDTLNGTFEVILPEALGIHAVNAADAEVHARRREAAEHQAGREDAVAEQVEQARAALAGLTRLEEMDVADLYMLIEVASGLIEKKRSDQPLRLVPMPAARTNGARHPGA